MLSTKVYSKVFVLGEYAVLRGGSGWVGVCEPSFELREVQSRQNEGLLLHQIFHPQSPAGKLLNQNEGLRRLERRFEFFDPHRGQGGFGGSTAEFLVVNRQLEIESGEEVLVEDFEHAWSVWRKYQEFFENERVKPSGADLLAQIFSKSVLVHFNQRKITILERQDPKASYEFLIFSGTHQPGRKIKTHEHLALTESALKDQNFLNELESLTQEGVKAFQVQDAKKLGEVLSQYAQQLSGHGLEGASAHADRKAFEKTSGVFGVKGCGARLSDVVLVCSDSNCREQVLATAQTLNLKFVTRGLF